MNTVYKSIIGAGILALIANLFFFRQIGASGFVFAGLLFNLFILFTSGKKQSFNRYTMILEGSVLLFFSLALCRTTSVIQALLITSGCGCTFLLAYLLHSGNRFFSAMKELIVLPLIFAGSYLSVALDALMKNKLPTSHKHVISTIVGFVIGIPIVILLIGLFSSADPIFGKTVETIFKDVSISNVAWRIIWTFCVFLFVLPWGLITITSNLFSGEKMKLPQTVLYPISIVMTLVALTLGVFLFVQWPYVFANVAAETDLSIFGVATYSEYVTKGFLEFLFISGILYALVWMGLLALRAKKEKTLHPLQIIQSIVIALFVIFLVSVGRRILLYWEFHGLSLIRVYGGIFLIWVSFLTFLLWARHFLNAKYIIAEIFGTLLFVAFLGIWNAEYFIYVHHPPTVNNQIDIVYLSRLSSDGYEGWKFAYEKAKHTIEQRGYQTKDLLDKDDRRELTYAGLVLAELTDNYHTLVMRYGSLEEKQRYIQALFIKEAPEIQALTTLFENDLEILKREGRNASVSAEAYAAPPYTGRDTLSMLTQFLPELKTTSSAASHLKSVSGLKKYADRIYQFHPRPSKSFSDFSQGTCSLFFYVDYNDLLQSTMCVPGFYVLSAGKDYKIPGYIDLLLIWNAKEQEVYKRLQNDIPLEKLFLLQDEYRLLWKNILSQPSNERIVDLDISFNAPLMDSVD